MDRGFERRVLEAFDEALAWPADIREAELERRHPPELRAAVGRLLAAHAHADVLPTEPPEPAPAAPIAPPRRIGAYRLAEELGRGGMGVVYRGERVEGGFEQTVAIKLMRGGLFSARAAEQFAQERRILARLRHPHITQLFDGGQAPGGLSYIVMERVDGLPITDHAAAAGLSLRERLMLLQDVCAAVEHAHANGVIHADLKPSNIVVDRRLGVKVLDFGIAALLDAERSARPRAQTPRYASPQQIVGEPADSGDDVYALGRILEDLAAPFRPDPELAAVIAKATAPERSRRYADVRALSADLERWLGRYPVTARPPSRARAAAFFARRHPLGVAGAGAGLAGLVLALVVTATLYVRAEVARREAEQRFDQVHSLASYLLNDITAALVRLPGTAQLRHDVADRGRAYLEALSTAPGAGPGLRLEAAEGYSRVGEALTQPGANTLGDPAAGKADLSRAEVELRRLIARGDGGEQAELALVRTLNARAGVAQNIDNQAPLATRLFDEACRRADRLLALRPKDVAVREARLDCWLGQANMMDYEGQYPALAPLADRMLAELADLPSGADPDQRAIGVARAHNLRGDALYFTRGAAAALPDYRAAAAALEAAQARRRDSRLLDQLAYTQFNLSSTLQELHRPAEELATIQRGVEIADLLRAFEDSPRAHHVENIVRMQKAAALSDNGRHAEAIAEALANMDSRRAAASASPADYDAARAVAVGLKPTGLIYQAAGRKGQACATFVEGHRAWMALKARFGLNAFDGGPELKELDGDLRAACPPSQAGALLGPTGASW